MKRADYEFNREQKRQIRTQAQQSDGPLFFWRGPANSPIHIPRRKKRK